MPGRPAISEQATTAHRLQRHRSGEPMLPGQFGVERVGVAVPDLFIDDWEPEDDG